MAFGQQQGFPASSRQVQRLAALVVAAGHRDFRDARGPLGLTQRQAGGKFTRDEADALIARLEAEAEAGTDAEAEAGTDPAAGTGADEPSAARAGGSATGAPPASARRAPGRTTTLRRMPAEVLAAELQRRGWIVVEP